MDDEGKHNTEFAQDEEMLGDAETVKFKMPLSQISETLLTFLERPYLMDVRDWTSGLSLTYSSIVSTYFKRNAAVRGKLEGYKYIRATVEIIFRVNTTKMQYGQFIAGYFPEGVLTTTRNSAKSLLMTEHIMVSAATQGDCVLRCPYIYYNPIFALTQEGGGTVYVKEYNPLLSISGGATVASIAVFMRLVDVSLHGYTDSVPAIREQSAQHFYQDNINGFDTVMDSGVHTPFQTNDVTSPATLAHVGPESFKFEEAYKYPHSVATYAWSLSDVVTTQVGSFRVVPNQQVYPNNYLQHIACAHMYWSGTLRFMVQVVASQFHSGRLQISYEPKSAAQVGLLAHQAANIVLDVQGQSEVIFDIPWMNNFPWNDQFTDNGTVYVKVLNSLSSNTDTISPVYINVFMYGTRDLKFYGPLQLTGASSIGYTGASVATIPASLASAFNFPSWMTITGVSIPPSKSQFTCESSENVVEEQYRCIDPSGTYPFADLLGITVPQTILKENDNFHDAGRVLVGIPDIPISSLYQPWAKRYSLSSNAVNGVAAAYFVYWNDMFACRRGDIDVFATPSEGLISNVSVMIDTYHHAHGASLAPVRGPNRNFVRIPFIQDYPFQFTAESYGTTPFNQRVKVSAFTSNANTQNSCGVAMRGNIHYYYLVPPLNLTATTNTVNVV